MKKKPFTLKNLFLITSLITSVQASFDQSVELFVAKQKTPSQLATGKIEYRREEHDEQMQERLYETALQEAYEEFEALLKRPEVTISRELIRKFYNEQPHEFYLKESCKLLITHRKSQGYTMQGIIPVADVYEQMNDVISTQDPTVTNTFLTCTKVLLKEKAIKGLNEPIDEEGNTLLHVACSKPAPVSFIEKMLKSLDIRGISTNNDGKNALDLALWMALAIKEGQTKKQACIKMVDRGRVENFFHCFSNTIRYLIDLPTMFCLKNCLILVILQA